MTSGLAGFIGRIVAGALPDIATNERLVKNRGARVYVDHLQNLPGKTIVAAYSARPKAGAPGLVPFFWEELISSIPPSFRSKSSTSCSPARSLLRNASRSPQHRRPHSTARSGVNINAQPASRRLFSPLVVREVPPLRRRNLCTSEWL